MKRLSCSFALAAMFASSASFAASTTDIQVTGTITPSACTPSFSGGGDFVLGDILESDLSRDQSVGLPILTKQFTVTCDAATRFALRGIDYRTDSDYLQAGYSFGVGERNGHRIGSYVLEFLNTLVDSNASEAFQSLNGGTSWVEFASSVYLFNHDVGLTAFGSVGSVGPSPVTTLTSDVHLTAVIAPIDGLDLTDAVPIDGLATLEVVYL